MSSSVTQNIDEPETTRLRRVHAGIWSVTGLALWACVQAAGIEEEVPDVQWKVAVRPAVHSKIGTTVLLRIFGEIPTGWHVYALTEPPGGPTALSVKVDPDQTVTRQVGSVSGPKPQRKHDRSFDLDTETYSGSFALEIPLRLRTDLAPRQYSLPLSVRFQSCSDSQCRPPRTVRLAADVVIGASPATQAIK